MNILLLLSLYILHGYMKLQIEDELAIGKVILDLNPLVFILNQSICNSWNYFYFDLLILFIFIRNLAVMDGL